MAEFALRSLATMAELNPSIQIPGNVPYLGSRLEVYNHWLNPIALLLIIVGLHLILLLASIWMIRSVVVTNDSSTGIARLLEDSDAEQRPMQRQVHEDWDQTPSYNTHGGLVYGPLATPNGNYILRIGKGVKPLNAWDRRRHPDGDYYLS